VPRKGRGRGHGGSTARKLDRAKLFAAAYVANGNNATEAARAAGYKGTPGSLATIGSRWLKHVEVRRLLDAHVARAVDGMKPEEIIDRLSAIARLPDTEIADVFDFITLIGENEARLAIEACNGDKERATAVLRAIEGRGFYVDLEKSKLKGLGRFVKEISHDTETGAPKLKLQDNVAVRELARRALKDLAEIRGLTRDQPLPPPRPNLTLLAILPMLSSDTLAAIRAAWQQAVAQQAQLPEAKRVGP
jgi:hypothetical protein